MDTTQLFRDRLRRDVYDIESNADDGIFVHTVTDDMRQFCLHLCPQTGPWKFLRIHLTVELPLDWPNSPPHIWSTEKNIQHPNITSDGTICCDLFRGNYSGYTEPKRAGYTPAYTLRGIFKQLLSMFSSSRVSDTYSGPGGYLGEANVVHYLTEAALVRPFRDPRALADRRTFPYNESEVSLESLWKADESEEVVIMAYQCEDGSELRQITKRSMMYNTRSEEETTSTRTSKPPQRIFKFESRSTYWQKTLDKLRQFECAECGYGTKTMSHFAPEGIKGKPTLSMSLEEMPYMTPSRTGHIMRLGWDVLQLICDFLPEESVYALGATYKKFDHFIRMANYIRKRRMRCYYLATHFHSPPPEVKYPDPTEVMGIGLALDKETGKLSCDIIDGYLSQAAFENCDVRRSVRKKEFKFFLPLAINYPHFQKVKDKIFDCLRNIRAEVVTIDSTRRIPSTDKKATAAAVQSTRSRERMGTPDSPPEKEEDSKVKNVQRLNIDSVNVLYKFLSDAIVDYLGTTNGIYEVDPVPLRNPHSDGIPRLDIYEEEDTSLLTFPQATERFLPIYWQVFHLLVSICHDNRDVLRAAHDRVRQFIDHPEKRGKQYEPDLGELVVVAALVFACQDEGLLPLQKTSNTGPERHHQTRYALRHSQSSQSSQTKPRDPLIRWSRDFAGPLLQEIMTRNTRHTLEKHPELQYFETGASKYRMAKTWQVSRPAFRSIALQVSMLAVFSHFETIPLRNPTIRHPTQAHLDRQLGNPPAAAITTLAEETKAIFHIATWGDFFTKIQYDNGKAWSDDELSAALRQCIVLSEKRGYHTNDGKSGDGRKRLAALRREKEEQWKQRHDRREHKTHNRKG
ncbi:hypothetical protein CPB86DRAFT_780828 [Serendipita vermifera]|nr:hypothetical protein CPB86DRAFT_780828 [Serendipita vermifera]